MKSMHCSKRWVLFTIIFLSFFISKLTAQSDSKSSDAKSEWVYLNPQVKLTYKTLEGEKQKRAIPFDTLPYLAEGIYDWHGTPVTPSSLYLAQLYERLGKQALINIGYSEL